MAPAATTQLTDAQRLIARAMPEATLLANVRELARLKGWRTYHTLRSKGSEAGFPDLVMVRRGRLIFAELKTEAGDTTAAQRTWLDDLASSCRLHDRSGVVLGSEVCVWRPSHWLSGEIEEALA